MLLFSIEKNSREPIYQQVRRHLVRQIESGALASGARLPATRALAARLGISRVSVVTAYNQLETDGLVTSQVGRGTYVAQRFLPEGLPDSLLMNNSRMLHDLPGLRDFSQRKSIISFSAGVPSEDFMPVEAIKHALDEVLTRDGASALGYESTEGYLPLRSSIVNYAAGLGIHVQSNEVLVTNGCQQALDLTVQTLLSPGDVLLTSNPTYLGILDICRAHAIQPVGAPVDHDGIQVDQVEALIEQYRPRLVYVAPTHHNPTGTVMPLARRRQLLEISARYNIPILEDDVYRELDYGQEPPLPLKALDEHGMVLYASGFSKVLLPGLRIGYLIAGGALREQLTRTKFAADICSPALTQRAFQRLLDSGMFAGHLERLRHAFRRRMQVALAAARQHLPPGSHWDVPMGGQYLWVKLPPGPTAAELYVNSLRHDVAFAIGSIFHTDNGGTHHIRLNVAVHEADVIEEGMRRLRAAWDELASENNLTDVEQSISHIL